MKARIFALAAGLAYLALGLLGWLSFMVMPEPMEAAGYAPDAGFLFGVFAVNTVLNFVHFLAGIWGVMAAWGMLSTRMYARAMAWILGALALMGLLPGVDTAFGLMPLHGHDVWLHALTAIVAAYIALDARARAPAAAERRSNLSDRRHTRLSVAHERRHSAGDRRVYSGGTLAAG